MKQADRARLTNALREHVAKIAADLRAKMRTPGSVRERALQLHADERVGEDFDVWTDLLSRRAAVLWVLKSVYVRVLEDRGLLSPGRLLDLEAQQLFERLAPHLGETAFLRWVYRDLASQHGGLPELFSPQPAEVAAPSDELSRSLLAFWRDRDADTGALWSFAEERFEGQLMGDLYQELDPVVKDRFALCQTPDFVRAFILDRTLTPAIETFGADEVRLLDPACGSGHFLIDGLKRLVAATAEKHTDWSKERVVAHALDRVVGIDLNDYACALARTRLIMTAAELAGVTKLAEAARFHPHVYWADGLEQVEKEEQTPSLQFSLYDKVEDKPRATLTRSDVRAALKKVFERKFHAVVANPPYILERDEARKEYHRELIGKSRRYVSATGKYSLGAPFTERCFQLAEKAGFVGLITSNNFTKREFGKTLIEKVLSKLELTLVVDASQAYIPFHSTPTVLFFGRNARAQASNVRAILGKKGEEGTPPDPSRGKVWLSIVEHWLDSGFDDEFISVADVARTTLDKHPWSLQGGGAGPLKAKIEGEAQAKLHEIAESIGYTTICGDDPVFIGTSAEHRRRAASDISIPLVSGDVIRDWRIESTDMVLFPYEGLVGAVLPETHTAIQSAFWPYRTLLRNRVIFGQTPAEKGMAWYEHMYRDVPKLTTPLGIAFAAIATHNHFVLERGGKVFKQSAPVVKLPATATEEEHLALLALLNSSVSCFWIKQVFYPKGSKTHDIDREGTRPENNRYDISATGMRGFPVPKGWQDSILVSYAKRMEELAKERTAFSPAHVLAGAELSSAKTLRAALEHAEGRDAAALGRLTFLQEEIDWRCYELYGLCSLKHSKPAEQPIEAECRPFAWSTSDVPDLLPAELASLYSQRREFIESSNDLQLLESPVHKRLWRGMQGVFGRYDRTYADRTRTAVRGWLAERVEQAASARTAMFTLEQLVATLQDDVTVLAVCEVLTGRRDFSLSQIVLDALYEDAVPSHRFHVYKPSGLVKREVWERTWADQQREDAGEKVTLEVPPDYASGDLLRPEYWRLRGKLGVPIERFIAFTEVPGRAGVETLYGWAGWTAQQRVKAILATDEELEDASVPLADRIGLLDSAWRLLPDVAREDAAAAARLKAELQALLGPEGPSRELVEDWKKRFPPPTAKGTRTKKAAAAHDDVVDSEESDES